MDACRNIVSLERTKRILRPILFLSYPRWQGFCWARLLGIKSAHPVKSLRSFRSRNSPASDAADVWNGRFAPTAAIRKSEWIAMSAFHPEADIAHPRIHVSFVPITDISRWASRQNAFGAVV